MILRSSSSMCNISGEVMVFEKARCVSSVDPSCEVGAPSDISLWSRRSSMIFFRRPRQPSVSRLFSLYPLLQKVKEGPGERGAFRMAKPLVRLCLFDCLDLQVSASLQEASALSPPLRWHRLVGCFSDLKCHTVT